MPSSLRLSILASGATMLMVVALFYGESNLVKAIALASVIIVFWLTDVIPLYVTALIPLALAGPMGLLTGEQISSAYAHKFVFLFLGGFVIALAMEKWDVHKQIALGILRLVGKSKTRVLLGFIIATGLLSMWISNTATTLMMLPMATAVTHNMKKSGTSNFPRYLILSIAYAASIGGMGTLVGSPPNTSMAAILEESYGIEVDFMSWMKVGIPLSFTLLTVLFLFFVMRLRREQKGSGLDIEIEKKPWSTNQLRIILLFSGVVVLWAFRKLIVEWTGVKYGDEHVAMMAAILLFVIPGKDFEPILKWEDTKKLAWGIIFLFGGGIALATMLEANGVIKEVVKLFAGMDSIHILIILLIVISISVFGTEVMSNTAMVNVFIPVIAAFAVSADMSILGLCMPVALAASCAFMLPVGTPPNAIVFSSGEITISQMARTGLALNIIAVLIVTIYAFLVFH